MQSPIQTATPSLLRRILTPDIVRALIYSKTTLVAQGMSLITVTVIIRTIGNEQFGIYQYALGLAGTALMFGHLGTDSTSFREFSMPIRHACGALPRILLLRTIGIIVSFAVLLVLAAMGKFTVSAALLLAVCGTVAAESLLRMGNGWHRARHLPWTDFITTSARSLLVLILVLLIVPRNPSARGIALAYGIGAALILITLLAQWWRIMAVGWKARFSWPVILKPAPIFMLLEASGNMIGLVPALVYGHWQLFGELGTYSVYAKYLAPFSLGGGLYIQSLMPSLVQALNRGQRIGPTVRRGAMMVCGAGLLGTIGALTIGAAMIYWLAKQPVLDLRLLGFLSLMPVTFSIAAYVDSIITAARQERFLLISHFSGIISAFLLALFLCPKGAWGAAAAMSLAFVFKALAGVCILLIVHRKPSHEP